MELIFLEFALVLAAVGIGLHAEPVADVAFFVAFVAELPRTSRLQAATGFVPRQPASTLRGEVACLGQWKFTPTPNVAQPVFAACPAPVEYFPGIAPPGTAGLARMGFGSPG